MERHPVRTPRRNRAPSGKASKGVRSGLLVGFALLAVWLLAAAPAAAHSVLQRASPGDADTVSVVPETLRLTFSRTVELPLAGLRLIAPDGAQVELAPLELAGDSDRVLIGRILGPLTAAGTYRVQWQIVSEDGHPVRDEYSFVIAAGAQGLAPAILPAEPVVSEPALPAPEPAGEQARFDAEHPLYAGIRWLTFVGLLSAIGVVAFRALVLSLVHRHGNEIVRPMIAPAARRAALFGLGAVVLLMVALVLRLSAQSVAVYGTGPTDTTRLVTLLTNSMWGWGWLAQAAGALLALAGFALARTGSRKGWIAAGVGTTVLGFSPALSGHAAATPGIPALAMLADALHVLGAGGWLGSLLAVVAVGIPVALRLPAPQRAAAVRALINAFSPTALAFAGMVVVTGLFASWLHLQDVSDLWESAYGRALLLKLGVLSVVFGTGAYNWLRVRPALGTETAAHHLRRSAALELVAGVFVLAVTAVLVATPPPGEMTVDPQESTASR